MCPGLLSAGALRVGAPFGDGDQAGRDRLKAGHEGGDLGAGAERDGLRGHHLVPLPGRLFQRRVQVARQVVARGVAAGRHRRHQRWHHRGRLRGVLDVGEREQQQDRDRQAEVQGRPRARHDRVSIADVRVDKADRAAGRGRHHRAGVRQHHRVVVHVRDAALGRERLGDLVGGAHERQPHADVKELPDSRLDDQEAQHALLEPAHGGRDGRYPRCGRAQDPRGLAVGLEVVMAAVQEIDHACRVRHPGVDQRGFRPAGRVFPPVVCHAYQYAPTDATDGGPRVPETL